MHGVASSRGGVDASSGAFLEWNWPLARTASKLLAMAIEDDSAELRRWPLATSRHHSTLLGQDRISGFCICSVFGSLALICSKSQLIVLDGLLVAVWLVSPAMPTANAPLLPLADGKIAVLKVLSLALLFAYGDKAGGKFGLLISGGCVLCHRVDCVKTPHDVPLWLAQGRKILGVWQNQGDGMQQVKQELDEEVAGVGCLSPQSIPPFQIAK